jgi:hypothetical protein
MTATLQTYPNGPDSTKQSTSEKDAANGYAGLDSGALLKATEIPALTGDVQSTAGTVATTVKQIQGVPIDGSPSDGQVPAYVAADGRIEWTTPFGGSGASGGVRATQSKTTGSLANNATENSTVTMNKSFTIVQVTVNKAARLRLYSTAAARTADAARANSVPPTPGTEHGCIIDLYLDTSDKFTWFLSPCADGANLDGTPTASIYYALTNLSGSTGTVTFTVTFIGKALA